MSGKPVNVAMIGQGFMGRAHSNGWSQASRFFDLPRQPVLHTVIGTNAQRLPGFAARWGWAQTSTDWRKAIAGPEIDLVDITSPNTLHAEQATAALAAGKAVACEKPIAGTLAGAAAMAAAARKAQRPTFVWYNYRRVPAVALAYQLVRAGRLGQIRHVRAFYLQDWAGPDIPLVWRFQKSQAGSGAHGDLNAHIVDMVRFVTGLEVTEVVGALAQTFIKERALLSSASGGGIAAGAKGSARKGKVTVDDAVLFLARLEGGAVGSFEAARQATGNQNRNGFEINGSKGALRFDFEDMNLLHFYDATADRAVQGWTKIMVTHGGAHPYMEAWWPDAHLLGYEHGFTHMVADMMNVLAGKKPLVPLPDFHDAYQTQRVLEAALLSAAQKRPVKLRDVR